MKIKVIDPAGLKLAGKKTIPEGTVFDQPKGPQLDAWLRFKQVAPEKEKKAAAGEEATAGDAADPGADAGANGKKGKK